MKSLVRLCLVSVVLAALAFFCDGLRVNFLSSPQDKAYIGVSAAASASSEAIAEVSSGSISDPANSDHSFIKFNTPCLSSPTAEGQTVVRTVTGASGNVCRHTRRTDFLIGILGSRILNGSVILKRSLPTLRKLRL